MEQHFVTLKRKPQSRLPEEVNNFTTSYLGSGFDSNTGGVLRGLSFEEERLLLPDILGCSATSFEFNQKAKEYWNNFDVPVPIEGKRLNITVHRAPVEIKDVAGNVQLKEIDIPENIIDYIVWRFAQKHSEVATTLEECLHSKGKLYYIEDVASVNKNKSKALSVKNKSRAKYLELTTGEANDINLLKAIAINTVSLHGKGVPAKEEELLLLLSEVSEEYPEQFYEVASDPRVKDRAFIAQLINHGIIKTAGNHIYDELVGPDAIAESIDEFIKYIYQPTNSSYKAQLLAKLQAKKGK